MPARLSLETSLYSRGGGLLSTVWATGDTATDLPIAPTGTTVIYSDPIAYGLGYAGVTPADPYNPTDADIARVPAGRARMVGDLAFYRLIMNALGSFTEVDETELDVSVKVSQLFDRWWKLAELIRSQYATILDPTRQTGASSGMIRHVPPTACPPRWGPGYGRPGSGYGPGGSSRYPWGGCR